MILLRQLVLDGEYTPEEIMTYLDEVIKDEEKENKDKK